MPCLKDGLGPQLLHPCWNLETEVLSVCPRAPGLLHLCSHHVSSLCFTGSSRRGRRREDVDLCVSSMGAVRAFPRPWLP